MTFYHGEDASMAELELGRISLPAEQYHADRSAVSKGWLDRIDRSPAHLRAYLDGIERPDTPALILGRLVHVAVLEPDLLTQQFVTAPQEINRRTKLGRDEYAAWLKENAHKQVVTESQLDLAVAMRDSVHKNKAARALLGIGDPEQTVVWQNSETGERCKARADWLRDFPVDVKTTQDARPEPFARSIVSYRYDVQAGHYLEGFEADRFVWIAVEKDPPYACAVYAVDDVIRARGRAARDRNLRTYAECRASNKWPAYPDVINTIELPRWALNGQ